jgi:hypothetical protein
MLDIGGVKILFQFYHVALQLGTEVGIVEVGVTDASVSARDAIAVEGVGGGIARDGIGIARAVDHGEVDGIAHKGVRLCVAYGAVGNGVGIDGAVAELNAVAKARIAKSSIARHLLNAHGVVINLVATDVHVVVTHADDVDGIGTHPVVVGLRTRGNRGKVGSGLCAIKLVVGDGVCIKVAGLDTCKTIVKLVAQVACARWAHDPDACNIQIDKGSVKIESRNGFALVSANK